MISKDILANIGADDVCDYHRSSTAVCRVQFTTHQTGAMFFNSI